MKTSHIIVADPTQGKTFLLVQKAVENAMAGNRVLFVNTELSPISILKRFMPYKLDEEVGSRISVITCNDYIDFITKYITYTDIDVVIIDEATNIQGSIDRKIFINFLIDMITISSTHNSNLIMTVQMQRQAYMDIQNAEEIISEEDYFNVADTVSMLHKPDDIYIETVIKYTSEHEPIANMYYIERDENQLPRFYNFGE